MGLVLTELVTLKILKTLTIPRRLLQTQITIPLHLVTTLMHQVHRDHTHLKPRVVATHRMLSLPHLLVVTKVGIYIAN